ncbi:SDR family oxidoreductase [Pontixanthobacter gangjinensis]|uniref:NAD(P)H-binding protein n=1 Tax=Pontixanthobacter gangjinensis TaxID=1028742 RepID=A0A6I4SLK3_9SPHN|nr:SDR family oxidoreductase [Pontixanthobacter gangjinensis]MXO56593.1 NAD(P)H-binding protein [Pontixanthobacter gangjinensis]
MQILIAGATGNTGLRIVSQMTEQGHHPIAMVREGSDTAGLPTGTQTRAGDLTKISDDLCENIDAVIFAAGSGGGSGKEMTDKVDRDGAKALVDNAKKHGVNRFVMLSSFGAGDPDPESDLAHYMQAKHDADQHLKSSGLDYTILRPVALTEEDGDRHYVLGDEVDPNGEAARGDVAALLIRAVDDPDLLGKTLAMQSVE